MAKHQVQTLRNVAFVGHHHCGKTALADLIAIAGRTDRTKFRHQVLNPLLEQGLIIIVHAADHCRQTRDLAA